jgi:hypothetical protein
LRLPRKSSVVSHNGRAIMGLHSVLSSALVLSCHHLADAALPELPPEPCILEFRILACFEALCSTTTTLC